jgi:argininosuccinate synthase
MKKIILAYSGGLDTTIILHWLKQKGYEVICLIVNVGQEEDFKAAQKKALSLGAAKVIIEDVRETFITNFIYPALQAQAVYEHSYLLGTSLARPLIAQKQVELAKKEKTPFLAHGATGKGNDQVRFELTYKILYPESIIIAPWKDEEFLQQFKGRADMIAYAQKHSIPIDSTPKKPYSMDANIMHTSYESGILENPFVEPCEEMFVKTKSLEAAASKPDIIELTFKNGIPTNIENKINGVTVCGPLVLFEYLNELGSKHGIGRIDIVENRFVGIKSRGVYETPGATILWKAHQDLETLVLDREVSHLKQYFSIKIAQLIYNGFWFSREMNFLRAAIIHSQKDVEGTVRITLYKGNVIIMGRKSEKSLYDKALSSMDELGSYSPTDATGFIKIQAHRLMLQGKKS